MSLAQMNWTRVSMHKVVWAWLRAERDTMWQDSYRSCQNFFGHLDYRSS